MALTFGFLFCGLAIIFLAGGVSGLVSRDSNPTLGEKLGLKRRTVHIVAILSAVVLFAIGASLVAPHFKASGGAIWMNDR